METWFAAVLGLVQGLTEFIPVSSTAHLRLAPTIFGQPDAGAAYSAVIQLGTLLAVIVYFARDLFVTLPAAFFRDRKSPEGRLPVYLILGTLPIVVIGLAMKDFITGDARSLYIVGAALIGVGLIFFVAESRGAQDRDISAVTLRDAMVIGMAQACALVPGVSRSGATIAAALFLGLRRAEAARFSFLLGIPAIGGAGILEMRDALSELGSGAWLPVTVGTAVAAISGYLSIAWLLRFLGKHSLSTFGYYRVAIGALVLILCLAGLVAPGATPAASGDADSCRPERESPHAREPGREFDVPGEGRIGYQPGQSRGTSA